MSFPHLLTSILFNSFINCFGGHNVYKTISGNLHIYTSNLFDQDISKRKFFIRCGFSYKICEIFYFNIIGFNFYKLFKEAFCYLYFYLPIKKIIKFNLIEFKLKNTIKYQNYEDIDIYLETLLKSTNSIFFNYIEPILFPFLRCLEVSVEYKLAKYYCISFDISSLIFSVFYSLIFLKYSLLNKKTFNKN